MLSRRALKLCKLVRVLLSRPRFLFVDRFQLGEVAEARVCRLPVPAVERVGLFIDTE